MKSDGCKETIYCDQIDVSRWTTAPLRIMSTVMINASPEVIFHTLSEPEMMCQLFSWMESVTVVSSAASGGHAVGALRTCVLGNGLVLEEEIVDWQPPHGYACRGIDATHPFGMRGHVSVLSLVPDECGCQTSWQHYFYHSNVPAMCKQLEQNMKAAVDALLYRFDGHSLASHG